MYTYMMYLYINSICWLLCTSLGKTLRQRLIVLYDTVNRNTNRKRTQQLLTVDQDASETSRSSRQIKRISHSLRRVSLSRFQAIVSSLAARTYVCDCFNSTYTKSVRKCTWQKQSVKTLCIMHNPIILIAEISLDLLQVYIY